MRRRRKRRRRRRGKETIRNELKNRAVRARRRKSNGTQEDE
jgi:hypothetical protein